MFRRRAILLSPVSFITKYAEDILRTYFDEVVLLSSVNEAIEYLKQNTPPDLIVSAYLLEDGDLFDFMEACKVENIKCPTIVMITSEEDEAIVKRAVNLGIFDIINKKVLREKLQEFLYDYVSQIDVKNLQGTVVCVEDSKVYAGFIKNVLSDTNLNFVSFERVEDAYSYIKDNTVDFIVVDFLLKGEYSGLDLIKKIRRELRLVAVPIMVITSFDDANRRLEFFKAGADDYLLKPFSKEEFLIKTYNLVKKYQILKEYKAQMERLKELYLKDTLTGAYNRNIYEFVNKEIEYAKRYKTQFSVVVFDFDDFKKVNDTYGHIAGDRLLVKFAKVAMSMIRKTDYFIRYGGDEFVLVLPGSTAQSAAEKAQEIIEKFWEAQPPELKIGVSAGVCSLKEERNGNLEDLIKMADEALYRAKHLGKNRVEILD